LTIPGIGPITASVLASEVGDGKQYRCGRDFAASLGLVPRQYSTGGRNNLLVRRHSNVVACALANKLARIVWAIAARHTCFEMKEAPMHA
jgi:transposase